jgi:hypothetical protein
MVALRSVGGRIVSDAEKSRFGDGLLKIRKLQCQTLSDGVVARGDAGKWVDKSVVCQCRLGNLVTAIVVEN